MCNPVDTYIFSFSGDYDKNISVYCKNGADSSETLAPLYWATRRHAPDDSRTAPQEADDSHEPVTEPYREPD
jgi:hypothetical protein